MNKPKDLPNINGYKFIGINREGKRGNCIVLKDEKMSSYYVDGDIKYCYLFGWVEIKKEKKLPL